MDKTKYRCTARNTAGKDTSPVINVDYKGKVFSFDQTISIFISNYNLKRTKISTLGNIDGVWYTFF